MLLKYITLLSGVNFLVFSLVLLFKKSPIQRANTVLGITFLMMTGYSFTLYYLYHATLLHSYEMLRFFVPIDYILVMLMGPAIYVYLRMVLGRPLPLRNYKTWLHALPALPAMVFAVYFVLLPTETRVDLLIANFEATMWQGNVLNALFFIQMTSYLFYCYLVVRKQLKISRKTMIGKVQIDIYWLKTFFLIDIAIMLSTAPIIFYIANDEVNAIVGQIAMDIQFIYIFIKSAWQTGIFPTETIASQPVKIEMAPVNLNLPPLKIQEPALKISDQVAEGYFESLMVYMKTQKPFLNEDCTMQDVADGTKIPLHHLSNILNQRLNKSFPDFMNEYRIEEAKKLLLNGISEKMTLEAIGYECGFGSKTSFNKAFKKHTSLTPSEYRKENKIVK